MNPLLFTQIQALLAVIPVTHNTVKATTTAMQEASQQPSNERMLSLLQLECDLLSKLAKTLSSSSIEVGEQNHQHHRNSIQEDHDDKKLSSLAEMANILLLPSLIILKYNSSNSTNNTINSKDKCCVTTKLALQSMYCKCIECAASVMSCYFDAVLLLLNQKQKNEIIVKPSVVIQCVIACATVNYYVESSSKKNDERHQFETFENVTNALLNTIKSLLNYSCSNIIGMMIATEMDGTLLARLAQMCLDSTNMLKPQQQSSSMAKNIAPPATTLHAVQTLQLLLQVTPMKESWQRLFPGCFSGLYRIALSNLHSRTTMSLKVAAASIATLSKLLDLTLVADTNNTKEEEKDATSTFIAAIKKYSNTNNNNIISNNEENDSNSQDQLFSKQINSRLPAPLNILLLLSTSSSNRSSWTLSSSSVLQMAGIRMIQSILLSSSHWWKNSNDITNSGHISQDNFTTTTTTSPLVVTAMECCMRLWNDQNPNVQVEAQKTIALYQSHLGYAQWKDQLCRIICPRLLALMDELPVLARRGQEIECINQMNLICGYLMLSSTKDTSIAVALTCPGGLEVVRRAIGALFEPDLDAIAKMPCSVAVVHSSFQDNELQGATSTASTVSSVVSTNADSSCTATSRYNALHLKSHLAMLTAVKMVRLVGATLRPAGCAKFIHRCMFDLQDELIKADWSKHGKGQINWLRQSLGIVILVNEICCGGFFEDVPLRGTIEEEESTIVEEHIRPYNFASSPKVRRCAFQLFRSLVPIIFHMPLWNLPTSVVETMLIHLDESAINEAKCVQYFSRRHRRQKFSSNFESKSTSFVPEVSSRALHGNATFLSEVIKLSRHLVEVIGAEVQLFLPDILFPLLEKTSSIGNHSVVQQAALQTLSSISFATSNSNIAFLLAGNFDYIADTALSRVRTPGGSQNIKKKMPPRLPGVIEVVLRFCKSFLEETKKRDGSNPVLSCYRSDPLLLHSKVCHVNDVIEALIEAFDVGFGAKTKMVPNNERFLIESVIGMFDAAVAYIHVALDVSQIGETSKQTDFASEYSIKCTAPVWLEQLLNEFGTQPEQETLDGNEDDDNSALTPATGFNKHHAERQAFEGTDCDLDQVPKENSLVQLNCPHFPLQVILRIMIRCSFFLSFPDLMIQKSSIDVLQSCIHCLAFADSEGRNDTSKASEFRRNELLPSINQIWPSVLARLRFTADAVHTSREAQSVAIFNARQTLSSPTEEKKVAVGYSLSSLPFFLESLLDLIATLCEVSGDFMKNRFEHETWPLIAKLLGSHAKRLSSVNASITVEKVCGKELISIMACIRRVYSVRDCGLCLVHLLPIVSIIVLPFLQYPGRIGDEAVGALEALIRLDKFCLCRELHSVCRCQWASNRLSAHLANGSDGIPLSATIMTSPSGLNRGLYSERDTMMVRRAQHLITFSSQLHEQLLY